MHHAMPYCRQFRQITKRSGFPQHLADTRQRFAMVRYTLFLPCFINPTSAARKPVPVHTLWLADALDSAGSQHPGLRHIEQLVLD